MSLERAIEEAVIDEEKRMEEHSSSGEVLGNLADFKLELHIDEISDLPEKTKGRLIGCRVAWSLCCSIAGSSCDQHRTNTRMNDASGKTSLSVTLNQVIPIAIKCRNKGDGVYSPRDVYLTLDIFQRHNDKSRDDDIHGRAMVPVMSSTTNKTQPHTTVTGGTKEIPYTGAKIKYSLQIVTYPETTGSEGETEDWILGSRLYVEQRTPSPTNGPVLSEDEGEGGLLEPTTRGASGGVPKIQLTNGE
eukprot:sb/3468886/